MNTEQKTYILPCLIAGGLLTGLTLVFPQLGFLEWLTMIPIFLGAYRLGECETIGLRRTYWYGFLTIFVFYFVIYHWFVYLYPLDFAGMSEAGSLVVILAGWVGLSLLQAIPGGLIFLFFKLLHRTPLFRRLPILRPIIFSALWIIFEWSSTLTWTGVPWGRLCLGQSEYLPMLQSASLFGSYFISLLLLLVNGLLAYAILYYRKQLARAFPCVAVAASLVLVNLLGGLLLQNAEAEPADTLRVGVVQGNISSHEKWSGNTAVTKSVYGDLTRQAAAEGAELIVWPETAFPYLLNRNTDLQNFVTELASECQVTLIIGALYVDQDGKEYNVLYEVTPDGSIQEGVYAKRHLVPFGEYVPLRPLFTTLIPPLAEISMLKDDLYPGEDSALFKTEWGEMGGLICFDSIYEELARDSVRDGAELLLLSSNDSWFRNSAAIYQHERQAVLRAIENGRYLVRSGNTGVSCVVTDRGEHLAWIDALESGYLVADVQMQDHVTLYNVIGNTLVYLCIFLCAGAAFLGIYWKKTARQAMIA